MFTVYELVLKAVSIMGGLVGTVEIEMEFKSLYLMQKLLNLIREISRALNKTT